MHCKNLLDCKYKRSAKQIESEDDSDEEMDKPFLVNWTKYNVKDNGQNILDLKLRNALKTINSKPEKYFKYFDGEKKPSFETVEIDHINFCQPTHHQDLQNRPSRLDQETF